jgi:hypothetical protein
MGYLTMLSVSKLYTVNPVYKGTTCTKHFFPVAAKFCFMQLTKLNSMALVHKQTMITERPPLVGEVSANVSG